MSMKKPTGEDLKAAGDSGWWGFILTVLAIVLGILIWNAIVQVAAILTGLLVAGIFLLALRWLLALWLVNRDRQ